MKRLFSIAIAAMLAGQAWAQTTFTSNGLKFTVTDAGNQTVSVSIDENNARATVNIPSTISYGNEDYTVTSIADYAFQGWAITSVVIPNTVISIGKNAFDECMALTSITIGNSVETIGDFAFISCAMTSITIPNSVISIGDRAFLECTAMTTISIGSSVASIGDLAFGFCSKLTEISVDSDNTSFASENGVLFNKDKTTLICCPSGKTGSYSIPGTVTTIGRCGFYDCRELTEVTIPDAVTAIGEFAFERCALHTITIPKDVETMGYNTFRYCDNIIIACIVAQKPEGWYDNWNPEGRPVVWGYKPLHYEITSDTTVQVVQSNDYKTMTGVLIPETVEIEGTTYKVTRIGESAFRSCDKLESLNIPKSVTEIGSDALWVCSGLKEINVYGDNKTFSSVDGVLFNKDKTELIRCPEKKSGSYTIPNTVTRLDEDAFRSCVSLTILNFPESVIDFGLNTLFECRGLTEINVDDNNTIFSSVDGVLFNKDKTELIRCPENRTDTSYTIPNTVTDIQDGAFGHCRNLTEINIPNSVKHIGNFAFSDCTSLKGITIPDGVTIIEGQTFDGCANLSSVTIPQSVTEIDFYAFAYCTSLESITIPSSVIKIASNAFRGCDNLTDMNLEDNNYYSFENQTIFNKDKTELVCYLSSAATDYTIPGTVTRIGDAAFCQTGITSVTIPESVTSIGFCAFSDCWNLTSFSIPNSVTDIENLAIDECNNLESVILPESVKHLGSNFDGCGKLVFNEFDNAYYLGTADNQYFALIKAKSTNITSCSINSNCKIIADDAFENCNKLTTIKIPESVTIIGQNAFANCSVLEYNEYDNAFYLGNNETQYLMLVKAKSKDITSCEINGDCQIIGEHAFDGCSQLSSITIPESVTSIGNHAFYDCSKLTTISIPNSVTYIGDYAFYGCSGLQLVSIPQSVTGIGEYAFMFCSNLVAVSVPKSVTSIGDYAFQYCSKLTLYCGAESKPGGWSEEWNPRNRPVVWNLGANVWLYTVNVKTNNNAYGSVSGGGIVVNGSTTQITASPKTGYIFVKWSNGLTNAIETITVTKDTTLTAEFAIKTYTVSVAANNSSYGTVGGGGIVNHGSTTTITATPATGYKFVKWSNGLTNATETITVTSDLSLTAEFAIKTYIVTVAANNSSYGTVDGGGTVAEGSTTTITATPATGYKFVKWSNGSTNASETITVTSDLTLTAEFAFIIPEGNQEIPENPIAETPADSTSFRFSILSSSEHTAEVSGYSGTSGNVVIPSKTKIDGVEYKVTAIGDQSFRNNSTVVSVTIPNTVTTIKSNAFRYCANLEYVVIPSSVTTIGEGPFCERNKLTAIYVDSENTNFVSYDGVLYSADMKKLVQYPCGKSNSAFEIPNTVERIEYGAFSTCPNLKSLVLPNSLKTIKWWAISSGSLQSLVIPNSVTTIEGNGIRYCKNLTIYCEAESKPSGWSSSWNSDNIPVVWGYKSSAQEDFKFTITSTSDKTVEVSDYTGTNAIVVIPKKTIIGGVEYTVTGIGAYSLQGCSGITSISIPNTVTSISNNAFANCTNMVSISIPNSVTTIGGYAFYNCKKLTSLTIPKSVTTIGNGLCSFCEELAAIVVESGNANYVSVDGVLYNSDMTQLVQYPVGKDAESFEFPETVTSTPRSSFRGCSNLKSITFNDKLTSIGGYAFNECDNLTSVVIKKAVTTIGDNAFMGCSNLTIYCEAESQPSGWDSNWNSSNRPVVWDLHWTVTLSANNDDYGTVIGGGSVANGSKVTIKATPATGCEFVKWSNGSTNATETITVTSDLKLTAEFAKKTCTVTVAANNSSYGTVTGGGTISNGSTTKITATPATGYKFVKWSNGLTNATETITVTKDTTLTAEFAIKTYTVTVAANNSTYGTVGGGGTINHGSTTTITATPAAGYEFVKWSNGSTNASQTITVTSDLTFTAEFAKTQIIPENNQEIPENPIAETPADSTSFWFDIISSSEHTAEVSGYSGTSGNVVIPSKTKIDGVEYTVTAIGDQSFRDNSTVVSVTIPNTVTTIKSNAFRHCVNLEYVVIPSSVTTIGEGPFSEYNKLTAIYVDSENTNFVSYDGVLYSADMKKLVQYPCSKPNSAFEIPNTVERIEYLSFSSCPNLNSLVLPSSLKTIKWWAIAACGPLKSLMIPNSVTTIEGNGIRNCKNLTIYCEAESKPSGWSSSWNSDGCPVVWGYSSSQDDFTFTITSTSDKTVEVSGYTGTNAIVIIPKKVIIGGVEYTVTGIGAYSLQGCSGITSISIPNTVTSIANNAFANCTSLASISISNSVTAIGGYAFYNCKKLASLTIPKSVTSIGNGLCSFCEELAAIVVESGNENYVTVDGVLYNSDMTQLVQYPIGKDAESFDFPETVTSTPRSSFRGCSYLKSITFNDKLTSIGGYAFNECDNLTSVVIKKSVTTIGDNAFMGCSSLKIYCEADSQPEGWDSDWNSSNRPVVWGISSGNNNEEFNPEDFTYGIISFSKMTVEIDGYNGTSSNIVIPSTVVLGGDEFTIVSIADETFKDCDNLVSVTLPSTITSIGDAAFQNCSNLESVSLPNTIETIGAGTFAECSSLTSVEIPNSVTFIGNSAFAESGLTSVVIPNSVTEISSYAFRDCADLASVEIPNSVATIGMCAFENCSELGTVVIPGSVSSIGIKAFSGCDNATFECEAESKPEGWDEWWNYNNRPVVWKNDSPGTAVAESAAAAVNIYAHGNTIVVENADAEIFVYDAMGKLVYRNAAYTVSTEIRINGTGIYVVKVGNTAKRVMVKD